MQLEPPFGEAVGVAGKEKEEGDCDHCHSELAYLLEVVRLLRGVLLTGCAVGWLLWLVLIGRRELLILLRILIVLRKGEIHDFGLFVAVVPWAAVMVLRVVLLGHHHHVLHIHHVLALKLHKRTNHLVFLLLRRRQAALELQLFYPVFHSSNLLHQLRLLAARWRSIDKGQFEDC